MTNEELIWRGCLINGQRAGHAALQQCIRPVAEPDSIGKAVSSGCTRMMNADAIDLYERVMVGTRVVVL